VVARAAVAGLGVAVVVLAAGCKPVLDETDSIVDDPRVLAVRSDPAEPAPGAAVKYTALYADGAGPVANPSLEWDFCEARKPLAELGPVNTECLQPSGSWFDPIGNGAQPSSTVPSDGCKLFGPDVPPPVEGQPQGRPVDPDPTGGYYQPVRVLAADGTVSLVQTRLACALGGASADVGVDYGHRYHPNTNPGVTSLSNVSGATAVALVTSDQGTNAVSVGEHLSLRAGWPSCPTATDVCGDSICGPDESSTTCPADCATPMGCGGAERFLVFDVVAQSLVVQREAIAVAWFATGGVFDADRTGRVATDDTTTSDNGWRAPSTAGPVHLWVVLRDSRGGSGWAEYVFDVQ
jgi:hypothetical protein